MENTLEEFTQATPWRYADTANIKGGGYARHNRL